MGIEDGAVFPVRRAQREEEDGRQRCRPPDAQSPQQAVEQGRRAGPGKDRQQQHVGQAGVSGVVARGRSGRRERRGGVGQRPAQQVERDGRQRRARRPVAEQAAVGGDGDVVALGEVVELPQFERPVGDHRPQQGEVAAVVAAGDAA